MTFFAFFRRSDLSRLDALRLIVEQPVIKPVKPNKNLLILPHRGSHSVWHQQGQKKGQGQAA